MTKGNFLLIVLRYFAYQSLICTALRWFPKMVCHFFRTLDCRPPYSDLFFNSIKNFKLWIVILFWAYHAIWTCFKLRFQHFCPYLLRFKVFLTNHENLVQKRLTTFLFIFLVDPKNDLKVVVRLKAKLILSTTQLIFIQSDKRKIIIWLFRLWLK
jgi:hypothetical protein